MFVYLINPPAKNCNIFFQETAYQHKGRRKKLQKNKSSRHNSVTAAVPWTNLIIKSCNAKRGTTMKMASRLIDLISRKTNCTCSTLFLLISKKQICTCQTSQLHTIFMEKLSYVLTQYFVSGVHVRFYFSLPLIFTLLADSICHFLTAASNFHVFLPTNFQ